MHVTHSGKVVYSRKNCKQMQHYPAAPYVVNMIDDSIPKEETQKLMLFGLLCLY